MTSILINVKYWSVLRVNLSMAESIILLYLKMLWDLFSYMTQKHFLNPTRCYMLSGACPGIRKGGGGGQNLLFLFVFQYFKGGPAQKIAEKMIFTTKKVAKI